MKRKKKEKEGTCSWYKFYFFSVIFMFGCADKIHLIM